MCEWLYFNLQLTYGILPPVLTAIVLTVVVVVVVAVAAVAAAAGRLYGVTDRTMWSICRFLQLFKLTILVSVIVWPQFAITMLFTVSLISHSCCAVPGWSNA